MPLPLRIEIADVKGKFQAHGLGDAFKFLDGLFRCWCTARYRDGEFWMYKNNELVARIVHVISK